PRPPLPFIDLSQDSVWVCRTVAPCNWLQGVEGTIDSLHVGTLHQSWIARQYAARSGDGGGINMTLASHPRYETSDTDYGLRAAALRTLEDGRQYVRVTEYVMPFVSLVPGGMTRRAGSIFIAVPIDNVSHMLFWGLWHEDGVPGFMAAEQELRAENRDIDNYVIATPGPDATWGQDRAAMANGHFSGFDKCLLDEDVMVQASMGPIVDRSQEHLCASDIGIVRARRRLLRELADFAEDRAPAHPAATVRPIDTVEPAEQPWREPA
ncbi:hypothetical protein, partial [Sphingomonas solaris]|uniref:hypothetical protein n=1 Tax=Alterirhizorhabdus solaris TaxID=2529389 RepID=UPI001939670F